MSFCVNKRGTNMIFNTFKQFVESEWTFVQNFKKIPQKFPKYNFVLRVAHISRTLKWRYKNQPTAPEG